jgi:AAA domain/Nuclease-related domain
MPRIVSPPLDELDTLRTPLNEGEQIVLDFFLANLSENWEIYIQPHLNGLRPDFVLLNPNVGIAVYEVKHWDLDAMPYRVEETERGLELWATNKQGKDFRVSDNPVDKIQHYKNRINNLYAPLIGQKCDEGKTSYYGLVTAGIIFTKEATNRVKELLSPLLSESAQKYVPIIGIDQLQDKRIDLVLRYSKRNSSEYMNEEIAKQLRGWLVEPDFAQVQRQPLELNAKQKALSTTRTKSGYRRIRGSAGSGKSLVLADRAANLSTAGKNILIVSFNITLWHYLRDLVVRCKVPGSKVNNITYMHFHEWCKDIIVEGGLESEYNKLFGGKHTDEEITQNLETRVVLLANKAIDNIIQNAEHGQTKLEQFDAILVDEGQDFNLYWWNTLRRLLKEDGEMLLVADESQDLYDRAKNWTDEGMKEAGFKGGPWNQLDICYRTPDKLISYLKVFAEKYLPASNIRLINAESGMLDLWPANLNWIQVTSEKFLPEVCAESILKIPEVTTPDIIAYPDLILLMPNHRLGLSCVDIIEAKGLKVLHIFSQDKKEQKPRKMNFFMGAANIKACTIHSFKGWEARYMVIAIDDTTDLSAVYVAMSRLKRHTSGSHLTVVCSNPKLRNFGMTWPSFADRSLTILESLEEIPF